MVAKVPVVPKPILIWCLRDFKYFIFPVVNYTSLFIKCCTKGASGTETHSHMLLKRFQVFYFSSCELYITVHKYVVPKVPLVPKPILMFFLRYFKYNTFSVVNYTSLFIKCGTKGICGTETHSHMLLKRFQVFYFSSCELYITVRNMWYQRCQWYRNRFSYASLEISSILHVQL